ncbi:MAG: VWA domain-containing protein [Prevotellaceae bacterium]|nr:VWA domain-containing protein [Prevotellaceae bacterium]
MKTNWKVIKNFSLIALIAIVFASCSEDMTLKQETYDDALALPNPTLDFTNINIPNPTFSTEADNVIRMDLAGILNPITKEWLELVSSNALRAGSSAIATVYVEVDGTPKYILVSLPDPTDANKLVDYVFLVDNSGSMSEEANAVADEIVAYAKYLAEQGLDIRFGCVGYESGVDGALNFTDSTGINDYLNKRTTVALNRTRGFSGADATSLQTAAGNYQHGRDECGSEAFRYADENFSFRNNSSVYYLNLTDEPNQPNGLAEWGVEWTKDPSKWRQQRGTIHTVFSQDTTYYTGYWNSYNERPWLMSEYTGGTTLFVNSAFTEIRSGAAAPSASMRATYNEHISLTVLPVTGAIVNSTIIRFKNTSTVPDGEHEVKITIQTTDKLVQGEKVFTNVTFQE